MDDFAAEVEATIARWHGIAAPNDPARRMAAELIATIRAFEALRGTLVFEDEPVQLRGRAARGEGVSAMTDLADLSLVEAADAVRTGDATSVELLDACWRNMEAVNPKLNATIWLDREGAEQAARAADRAVREQGLARPAARRADDAQGHVLPGGQAQHLRLGAAPRLAARGHRDRDRAAERGRRLHVRRPQHGGVRAEPDRSQSRVRRLPQSVEPALHHRRIVVRIRRLGRGAVQLHGAGLRHRRFDPAAGGGVRRHRHQADADPRVALRRDAAVVQRTTMSGR